MGLCFDCLCVFLLAVLPLFFHWLNNRHDFVNGLGGLADSAYAAVPLLLFSLFSPLPLLALRFVCKTVMKMSTPGEMLCGYSSLATEGGLAGALQQLGLALCQYMLIVVSLVIGSYIAVAPAEAVLTRLLPAGWTWLVALVDWILIGVWQLFFLSVIYSPCSAQELACGIEKLAGLRTVEHTGSKICKSKGS